VTSIRATPTRYAAGGASAAAVAADDRATQATSAARGRRIEETSVKKAGRYGLHDTHSSG
jgi:hypothetical protein